MGFLDKVFGTHSQREVKRIEPIVDKIEAMRDEMVALSDEALRDKTRQFKERLAEGATLDDILPRRTPPFGRRARRVLGMEHFRVQLIGGVVLHQGRIAEMKTGEGKTLVATLPAYLNALEGKGVHIVTVNDYLAKRDAEWMGKVHEFLGLTVGVVLNDMNREERQAAYNCDITYITNNELGFDYLRDNMVVYEKQLVQRGAPLCHHRRGGFGADRRGPTPLIISGQSGKSTKLYEMCDTLARQLTRGEDLPEFSKMDANHGRGAGGDRRLHRQREGQGGQPDPAGCGQGGEIFPHRQPGGPRESGDSAQYHSGAAGSQPHAPGSGLCGKG